MTVADEERAVPAEEDRPAASPARPAEPDLLWVRSVSERLLGPSAPPPPWEQVYFSERQGGEDDPGAVSEADADWAEDQPAPRQGGQPLLDLTDPALAPPDENADLGDLGDRALRLALASGNAELTAIVLGLLEQRAQDRARLSSLDTALRALLDQTEPGLPAAALLRRLLKD